MSRQLPSDALELALELVGSTILHNSQVKHLQKEKVEPSIRKEKKLTEFASNTCTAIQGSRPHQNITSLLPCVASTSIRYVGSCRMRGMDLHGSSISRKQHWPSHPIHPLESLWDRQGQLCSSPPNLWSGVVLAPLWRGSAPCNVGVSHAYNVLGETPELLGATQRWLWCPKMTRARGAQGRQRPSECAKGTWQSRLSQHCSPSWRCTRYKKVLKVLKMFKLNGCDVPWRCLFETEWHRLRGLGFTYLANSGTFCSILSCLSVTSQIPFASSWHWNWLNIPSPHQNWRFCYQISISDKHQKWRINMKHVIFGARMGQKLMVQYYVQVTTFQGPWVPNLLSRIITPSQPAIHSHPTEPDGAQEASVRNFLHQSGTNAKNNL